MPAIKGQRRKKDKKSKNERYLDVRGALLIFRWKNYNETENLETKRVKKKRLEGLVSSIEGERVTLIGSVMLYRDEPVEKPTY